jgi:hypothetical protein
MWRRNKRKHDEGFGVDLSELTTLLWVKAGCIAYGNYFKENYKRNESGYILTLLMPRKMFGKFGREVHYISSSSWLLRHCRYLFPSFDIWHATHQLSMI